MRPCKIDTPEGSYELEAEWLITFGREMSIWFGTREVRLLAAGRGHTAGDSICWLPQDRVLFTGDLLEQRATPYTGEGFLSDWIVRLDELDKLEAKVAMPGRGAQASVTPFGGGSSVVGGVEPQRDAARHKGALTIDLRELGRVLEVDKTSRAARIEAGAFGRRWRRSSSRMGSRFVISRKVSNARRSAAGSRPARAVISPPSTPTSMI